MASTPSQPKPWKTPARVAPSAIQTIIPQKKRLKQPQAPPQRDGPEAAPDHSPKISPINCARGETGQTDNPLFSSARAGAD